MGTINDCLRGLSPERESTSEVMSPQHQKARNRYLQATPQWHPPSPAFLPPCHSPRQLPQQAQITASPPPPDTSHVPRPSQDNGHSYLRPVSEMTLSAIAPGPVPCDDNHWRVKTSGAGGHGYHEDALFDGAPIPQLSPIQWRTGTGRFFGEDLQTSNGLTPRSTQQRDSKPKVARRLFNGSSPQKSPTPPSLHATDDSDGRRTSSRCRGAVVDVNFANVHELRVIGFTQEQAAAVVDYRVMRHQHFHSKSEVKMVPGVDEETWLRVQSKITLVPFQLYENVKSLDCDRELLNGTHSSGSTEALGTADAEVIERKSSICVDLNSCNYHQLCVVGLNKPQAMAVITYRVAQGHYKFKEDIKLVPGISDETYQRVQSRLSLVLPATPKYKPKSTPRHKFPHSSPSASGKLSPGGKCLLGSKSSPFRVLMASPSQHIPLFGVSESESNGVFPSPPDSPARSTPGVVPQVSVGRVSSAAAAAPLRIASWNLQVFNEEKASKPEVLEVICSVIINHGFDAVAVQEIGSTTALQKVCQELNTPTLPKVLALRDNNSRQWDSVVSEKYTGRMFQGMEYNGFLWNKRSGISLVTSGTADCLKHVFVRKPFLGKFLVGGWSFTLASVHLKAENWGGKDKTKRLENEVCNLPMLIQTIDHRDSEMILLGDFNMHPNSSCFQPLRDCGYINIISDPTNVSAANPDGTKCYDNIWISSHSTALRHNGTSGVIRRTLLVRSPRLGDKDKTVSDHCPIWAGFRT